MIVLLIVLFVALQADRLIPNLEQSVAMQLVVLLTARGLYELMIQGLFFAINTSEVLLRLYWGRLYINGLWSYEYTLNGRVSVGVWDISQDMEGVQIVGNGLDDNFHVRTVVRSVSPLIEEQGGFFVLNSRDELNNDNAHVFSKTTLLLDRQRRPWSLIRSMRAITEIFGGPSDKQVHPNVIFTRHPGADSVEDVIKKLREEASLRDGQPGGNADE